MMKTTRYVGLDVHGETIAAAMGDGYGKARSGVQRRAGRRPVRCSAFLAGLPSALV